VRGGLKPSLSLIKKILIIRIDRIGDLVCTIPSIRALRKNFPDTRITALLSLYNSDLISDTELVDDIIVWKNNMPGEEKQYLIKNLKERKFDVVLVFSPYTEAYKLAYLTGANIRAGIVLKSRFLTRVFASFCLNYIFLLDQEGKLRKKEPLLHEVEKGFALLEVLGIKEPDREINLLLPEGFITECRQYLNSGMIKDQKGIIGLPLCSRYIKAGWSVNDLAILAEDLRYRFPEYLLLITSGNQEIKDGEILKKRFLDKYGILVRGPMDVRLWAAFMQNMSLVITIDSGAVHLASSGKVSSVVLYPPEIYELCSQEWVPWKVRYKQLIMKDFKDTRDEILEAADELLKGEKGSVL